MIKLALLATAATMTDLTVIRVAENHAQRTRRRSLCLAQVREQVQVFSGPIGDFSTSDLQPPFNPVNSGLDLIDT